MKLVSIMRVNRYVIDTNIWISYFITRREQKLIDIIIGNHLLVFSCSELQNEITEVLQYPHLKRFNINPNLAVKLVQKVTVDFSLTYPIKRYIPIDLKDDYLIALALQTNSGFVTSGDQDILSEKENLERKFKKLQIITKAEFENRFIST